MGLKGWHQKLNAAAAQSASEGNAMAARARDEQTGQRRWAFRSETVAPALVAGALQLTTAFQVNTSGIDYVSGANMAHAQASQNEHPDHIVSRPAERLVAIAGTANTLG